MKIQNSILTLIILLFGNIIFAQNKIIVQNGSSVNIYSKLDSAIVHANNGDTIYLSGGSWNLSYVIDKNIVII